MDSYSLLLERTRLPQPSLQKHAVISIFNKLRSSPPHLNLDSDPGRDAISQCLYSKSPPVVDQSVRELCRLVNDGVITTSRGLLDLQSALEGCDPRFIDVFVKGIGFVVRISDFVDWKQHPFVRVLSCGVKEAQPELVKQVLLFIAQCKKLGLVKVLRFLEPLLNYSFLRIPFVPNSASFGKELVSGIASLCCSFSCEEALPVFELMVECLKYFPRRNANDFKDVLYIAECLVDAYTVTLTHAVETGWLKDKVQSCGVELVETLLSFCTDLDKDFGGTEAIIELSKRLLFVQRQLGLEYFPDLSLVLTSLFIILSRTEFEHEQLSVAKLSFFLLKWEREIEHVMQTTWLLFLLPVINLLSSPSGSVKAAAADLLSVLEKVVIDDLFARKEVALTDKELPSISTSESIMCRLLRHLWLQEHPKFSSSYYLSLASNCKSEIMECDIETKSWVYHLRKYCLLNVERKKSHLGSRHQDNILIEMSLLLSSVVAGLVMNHSLGSYAVDTMAAIGIMDPKLGLPLLLSILFYSKKFCNYESSSNEVLLKLLEILPTVASHSAMVPLTVQTILPMLNKDAKPVMRATATRLLCKTWEVTDRVFGSLQGALHPKAFGEFVHEKNISISMASSIRDVCLRNPDRGVDLILSISACIESPNSTVQTLGFQSLGYLCEADVIDFYSAWSVIGKYAVGYSSDPTVAQGICFLLRYGAMDAEAYLEASKSVLEILWEVGTSKNSGYGSKWVKAQCSAFESLTQYEIELIQRSIPEFKTRNMQFLVSEQNPDVLSVVEGFEIRVITFQHNTRRRLLKEKRTLVNKVEKLLDDFPHAVFHSAYGSVDAKDLPGAALLCGSFTPKEVSSQGTTQELPKLHAVYETALVDIAESLQLSRNILVAILSLQSWKPFMERWMEDVITLLDVKLKSSDTDKILKAAADILKIMKRIAEESIPRSAENIVLAVGALCMVLPPSAHTVTTTALTFLLECLFQFEHEHMQWSAAIALGVVSTCLHTTDHKQKIDIITGLLNIGCSSKRTLVKGACGVGLGFACQDLCTWVETADGSKYDETRRMREVNLVSKIVRTLSMIICQLSPSSSDSLERLCEHLPSNTDDMVMDQTSDAPYDTVFVMEEDVWGITGLILGLGNSVTAIYRVGGQEAVSTLKTMLMSWIPHANPVDQNKSACNVKHEIVLSVGSCLAVPVVIDFCLKVELVIDDELNHIVSGYRELIYELLSVNKSGTLHQNLLMASYIGAGSLLSCILDEGVHSIKIEDVKSLLELFRKGYTNSYHPMIQLGGMLGVVNALGAAGSLLSCILDEGVHSIKIEDVKSLLELFRKGYTNSYHPMIQLGGMLGVVNALGAGAGTLTHSRIKPSSLQTGLRQKDSSYIRGPILSTPVCEQLSASFIQEMFLRAQDFKCQQLQKQAAWAVSFLRHKWWHKEPYYMKNNSMNHPNESKPVSQTFPEDTVVWQLSLWLAELNYVEENIIHVNTVSTVLRCLSEAPRLPSLDWGAIIRRCMRYEDQVSDKLSMDHTFKKRTLREECVKFALAHANHVSPLLQFLDELCDVSRFRTIEVNLQTCILCHLEKFIKIFSGSRIKKLLDDITDYFSSSSSSYLAYNPGNKSLLRVSCWKGMCNFLEEGLTESLASVIKIERCMELLFATLPALHIDASSRIDQASSSKEWSAAIRCLAKAQKKWLMKFLEIPEVGIVQGGSHFHEVIKRIQAGVRLVMIGSIPLTELGNLRASILLIKADGIWDVLVEVVSVLQRAEGSIRSKWLVEAVEISCITSFPSTALKFIGLLAGSCCRYMPLLILDQVTVLSDLPVTLPSLFSDPNWTTIADSVVLNLWRSTERMYNWTKSLGIASDSASNQQSIDESESIDAVFLTRVMHNTCISLKDYLPFDKQLQLADMTVL